MKPVIGFCGMGHLGQHSAAAAYKKGFTRITYEIGRTGDSAEDLRACDIVYICPDRPGFSSYEALTDIALRHMKSEAILVVLCQVIPGFTRTIQWPKVYYQVETLRMKDAEQRASNPDRIILGCHEVIAPVDIKLLTYLTAFKCPVMYMSYESAELAKIAINVYLAAQVCVTGTLSAVAKKIGANWNEIVPALQSDRRIGKEAYLKPGNGCGAHLERDLKTINQYDTDTSVTEALLKYSEALGDNRE